MNNKKNQPAWRTYTFAALILAALACIATFFLAIIRGLVSMQVFTVANTESLFIDQCRGHFPCISNLRCA
jgi:hypothetical protein